MRRIPPRDQAITVTVSSDPATGELRPVSFTWKRARYVVTDAESWEEAGRWWEKEPGQTVWRVRIQRGGMMELAMLHTQPPQWRLLTVWD